jgi:hypothetical protein
MDSVAINLNPKIPAWKLGCLTGMVISLVLAVIATICITVFSSMRNSEAVRLAVGIAKSNPAVAAQLGTPIKAGWIISGSITETSFSGYAEVEIPLSGPLASGTIYAVENKQAGHWYPELLQFGRKNGGERIDLLPRGNASPVIPQ